MKEETFEYSSGYLAGYRKFDIKNDLIGSIITQLSNTFIGLVLTKILSFLKNSRKAPGGWGFFFFAWLT